MKDILEAKSWKCCFTIQITLPYLRNELAVGSICGLELDAYSNVLVMHIVMLLLRGTTCLNTSQTSHLESKILQNAAYRLKRAYGVGKRHKKHHADSKLLSAPQR